MSFKIGSTICSASLLRRISSLTVYDDGNDFDDDLLRGFGFMHLHESTLLTSLTIENFDFDGEGGTSVRGTALVWLLADAPRGLLQVDLSNLVDVRLSRVQCDSVMHRLCSFRDLELLCLSPGFATASGFFAALAAGAPWPRLKTLEIACEDSKISARDVALLGRLTSLTALAVDGLTDIAVSFGLTALSSLTGLQRLQPEDVFSPRPAPLQFRWAMHSGT